LRSQPPTFLSQYPDRELPSFMPDEIGWPPIHRRRSTESKVSFEKKSIRRRSHFGRQAANVARRCEQIYEQN